MLMSSPPNESLAIVLGMLNDRSGLWLITEGRTSMIRDKLSSLSQRTQPAAQEMLAIADSGGRFWPTKAEYYAAVSEMKKDAMLISKAQVDAAIDAVNKGARLDNISDKMWVKQALDILSRISKEKQL
jgi:hypothetical protein